jgi:polysaccharide transporter, PST family
VTKLLKNRQRLREVVGGVRTLLRHGLVQNILSLYAVQVASYLVPLVTIPYLARVLGAAGWGLVAFAQAFGGYLSLGLEYGFVLSGTREVARHRDSEEKMADVLAGVQGAKLTLLVPAIVLSLVARHFVPIFRTHPGLFWAATFWAVAQAFSMLWYFQGLEQMRLVAILDVSSKTLAAVGIFALIRAPGDEWKVLALQGAAAFLSMLVATVLAYQRVRFRLPSPRLAWEALRMGWSMFLFRGASSLYTVGNAFILGLFASPTLVGYYAGAEKISRAVVGLLNPVSQSLFPRLSHLVEHARDRAARLARLVVVLMGAGGGVLGLLVFLLAPTAVRLILGPGYEPSVLVLRILALLPPLIALSNVFGIQWMVPLGLDRPFNMIIMLGGGLNLTLALLLASRFTAIGMAAAVVTAEAFVTGAMYAHLRWRKLDPASCVPRVFERPT